MRLNTLFIALAALGVALAPAGRLAAQTPATPSAPAAHAHHGNHGSHGAQGAHAMPAAGEHAPTPAMLLMHRAELGLTDAQATQLRGLKADDAAGARAVLTAEQQTRIAQVHQAMMAHHQAGHAGEHGDCCKDGKCCEGEDCCKDGKCCEGQDCCKDGKCRHEECCRDGECCEDGKCSEECCKGMSHAQHGAHPASRP